MVGPWPATSGGKPASMGSSTSPRTRFPTAAATSAPQPP